MRTAKEHKKWIHLTNVSGGMKPVSDIPHSPLHNLSSPTSYSSPWWSDQVHASFNQIQAGTIWRLPASASLSPSTYPSPPAPELSNANQGFGARRYPSHAHAFATQEHRGVILYGPLLTNSDRSQWIDVSSFQPLSRQFWDAFYMMPEKCWGIKHPLPLAVGDLTM